MRQLLPYEQALIEALDITEDEYFEFRKAQAEYKDEKAGTLLDIRNGPATPAIALALSIIGTVAQVVAALIAPRPEAPEAVNQRRVRERRFAPRYGFDSFQEIAQYGDPVNLVYANYGNGYGENPNGGVRVNTSLLWSAVYSTGNAQYVQLLAAIGASEIYPPDFTKTAFGQTLTKLFTAGSSWQYFENDKVIRYNDIRRGRGDDPYQNRKNAIVYRPTLNEDEELFGFSQAFTPTSSNEFGLFSPVPIKVSVFGREEDGDEKKADLNILLEDRGAFWPSKYFGRTRQIIQKGEKINLRIKKVKKIQGADEADDLADEIRYAASESIEKGILYKLGSALFQVDRISGEGQGGDQGLDEEDMIVYFECVKEGYGPWEDYQTEDVEEQRNELKALQKAIPLQIAALEASRSTIKVSDFVDSGLSAKKRRIIDRLVNLSDETEESYEAIMSYRRNRSEMDELVLDSNDFDDTIKGFAADIRETEKEIEDLKDDKEKYNGKIERLEDKESLTADEKKKLKSAKASLEKVKKNILDSKKLLRRQRSALANAIREKGVADGNVRSQLISARRIANSAINSFEGVNVDLGGFPNLNDRTPSAKLERLTLRKLKNYIRRLESKVLAAADFDSAALAQAYANLDAQIALKKLELQNVISQLQQTDLSLARQLPPGASLEETVMSSYQYYSDPEIIPNSFNDYLGTKCIAKVSVARYEMLTPSHIVHFSIKARVFMRIQGRAARYGEKKVKEEGKRYRDSDNGNKPRTAMFTVRYKKINESSQYWRYVNAIFCVRRRYDKENYIPFSFAQLTQTGSGTYAAPDKWEFEFEPITDPSSEALRIGFNIAGVNAQGEKLKYIYLENRGNIKQIGPFYYRGYSRNPGRDNLPPVNKSPYGVDEWMLYSTHSDTVMQASFDSGPEFKITAVTEQQLSDFSENYYKGLSVIGFNAYSGAGITSLRSLSVFATKGRKVRGIQTSPPSYPELPNVYSSLAPDIFLDTILDKENGIGQYADPSGIDIARLAIAKNFCINQSYHMDGVIADKGAWRTFWAEVAPHSLLELARIGGKETLIPAVPHKADGSITDVVTISALFNQGNILEESYKEDFLDYGETTEDLIATVVYRDQSSEEPFPRNTNITVRLKDTDTTTATRRTFDLSSFVTNRHQALHYAILLVQQRRHIRRGIEFSTFPTEAPVEPGSYIYVQIDDNEWDNMHSGVVLDDGTINIPFGGESITGTYSTLIYKPGSQPIKQSISYTNGQAAALSAYAGTGALFVLGTESASKRVFRVVGVALEAEGEVKISAVEHPCREEGGQTKSNIVRLNANGQFDESLFFIDN
jgi:hypothetical protein